MYSSVNIPCSFCVYMCKASTQSVISSRAHPDPVSQFPGAGIFGTKIGKRATMGIKKMSNAPKYSKKDKLGASEHVIATFRSDYENKTEHEYHFRISNQLRPQACRFSLLLTIREEGYRKNVHVAYYLKHANKIRKVVLVLNPYLHSDLKGRIIHTTEV